jgi:hypothetical protein
VVVREEEQLAWCGFGSAARSGRGAALPQTGGRPCRSFKSKGSGPLELDGWNGWVGIGMPPSQTCNYSDWTGPGPPPFSR